MNSGSSRISSTVWPTSVGITSAPSRTIVAKKISSVSTAARWRGKPRRWNQATGADKAIATTIAKNSRRIAVMTFCRNQSSTTAAPAARARPSQDVKTAPLRVRIGGSIHISLAKPRLRANDRRSGKS